MAPTAAAAETFHVNGVDLAWSERGSCREGTPTLVLCHGFTGSSLDFALQVDALAADRRVVTLDQRGHGASTRTGRLEGYTIEQLSADLVAFIEAVGSGPVDLLGHSMGGRVVMGLVQDRPDLVRSLILMDTTAWSFAPPDEVRARSSMAGSPRSTPPGACPRRSTSAAPRTPSSRLARRRSGSGRRRPASPAWTPTP